MFTIDVCICKADMSDVLFVCSQLRTDFDVWPFQQRSIVRRLRSPGINKKSGHTHKMAQRLRIREKDEDVRVSRVCNSEKLFLLRLAREPKIVVDFQW